MKRILISVVAAGAVGLTLFGTRLPGVDLAADESHS